MRDAVRPDAVRTGAPAMVNGAREGSGRVVLACTRRVLGATARQVGAYALAIAGILAAWHLLAVMVASPALPTPGATVAVFTQHVPALLPAFWVSLYRVAAAIGVASVLAAPLGLLLGRSARLDAFAAPVLAILYPIPKIVLLPVLLVLLGLGDAAKIALMAVTVFFQVLVSVRDAARLVPDELVVSVRSLGASRLDLAWYVVLPSVLPSLFSALRVSSGTAVAILFLAEAIAGSTGLGYFIMNAWAMVDYPAMFAGIIAMAALGVACYELFHLCEYLSTPWRRVRG